MGNNMKPIIHYYPSGSDYSESIRSSPSSIPSLDDRGDSVSSRSPVPTPGDSSISTYRSTESSLTDLESEYEEEPCDTYDRRIDASYKKEPFNERAVPATPNEFADLFPTTERLMIKHDDSSSDGNMNLRVDAIGPHGFRVTLFHARMYDIRDRDVSIRRYGRDCGREVAHAKRRFEKPSPRRPILTKALTTSFRGKNELPWKPIQRQDSGYHSEWDEYEEDEEEKERDIKAPKPTNSMSLEFSNYAHVDLTRRGTSIGKKYDFEYWGYSYSWRRTVGANDFTTYTLVNNNSGRTVATMSPDPDGRILNGLIRPYSLYFKDCKEEPVTSSRCDVFDVLVSTGLMTLIDDTAKRRYNMKRTLNVSLPVPGAKKLQMEYIGPRRFMYEMFGSRANNNKNTGERRPSLARSLSTSMKLRTPSRQ